METLWQLEANIDDMNPQNMEYVFDRILKAGANDVWAMPMLMKKGRMASMLCVLCRRELIETVISVIVRETTSIGVRYFPVSRLACERLITTVRIDGRDLHCKVCRYGGKVINISAEYDDCRAAAAATGIPLKDWQRKVKDVAYKQFTE
ncbi:nickel insertion protein [Megasphaera sp.]|uniref:nickel insertion protein n=2 Tax=Megasphaera TaxID=906 RepID=UPI0025FCC8AE|nr:nickel insertion protein [uncultured Megasphaera sp.]